MKTNTIVIVICAFIICEAHCARNVKRLRNPFFLPTKKQKTSKEKLSIKLIGMICKQKKAGAIISYGAGKRQKVVEVGDSVAGYKVATIVHDQITLKRNKNQLVLRIAL